jgi:hypothetical protein
MDTLSIKKYPSCYYALTAIDAALRLRGELGSGVVDILDLRIRENILTYLMDLMFEYYVRGSDTQFTVLEFYTPYLVSCALVRGDSGPGMYEVDRVGDGSIWKMVNKARYIHDFSLTRDLPFYRRFTSRIGIPGRLALLLRAGALVLGSMNMRNRMRRIIDFDESSTTDDEIMKMLNTILKPETIDEVLDFAQERSTMGVVLEARLGSGRRIEVRSDITEGLHGTGMESKRRVAEDKFSYLTQVLDRDRAGYIKEALVNLEKLNPSETRALVNYIVDALSPRAIVHQPPA